MIKKLRRRSIRLVGYDYGQSGAYFVTICAKNRKHLFGEIINGAMLSNRAGDIVRKIWEELSGRFPNIVLDTFIVMPNHVHGIIQIIDRIDHADYVGAGFPRPKHVEPKPGTVGTTDAKTGGAGTAPLHKPSLGQMVAFFKYTSTKRINEYRKTPVAPVWQRNYYEHVIRADKLNQIRQYILDNPANWDTDENNPKRINAVSLTGFSG